VLDALAHTDDVIDPVPETLVERDGITVRGTDLEIDLRAAQRLQSSLCVLHEFPCKATETATRIDREVVDPTPVPLVSGHYRCNKLTVVHADEEEVIGERDLARYVLAGIVPWPAQVAFAPQRNYRRLVLGFEGSDPHLSSLQVARSRRTSMTAHRHSPRNVALSAGFVAAAADT
jgi:hypothetical protein